jgi:nickel/cobalt exporter
MSATAAPLSPSVIGSRRLALRLGLAAAAVALVAGVVALVVWALASPAPPPVKAPFGLGMREAAPAPGGIGGLILSLQAGFYRGLQGAVLALKASGAAVWTLLGLGFAYGVFHAAGPGHGKAVIAAYLVANERALLKGFALSLARAAVQALVAIAIVGAASVAMQATAASVNRTVAARMASFLAVLVVGAVLTWRKAGHVLGVAALARDPLAGPQAAACDHVHLPPPEAIDRLTRWREVAGIVLAAGIRPCSGRRGGAGLLPGRRGCLPPPSRPRSRWRSAPRSPRARSRRSRSSPRDWRSGSRAGAAPRERSRSRASSSSPPPSCWCWAPRCCSECGRRPREAEPAAPAPPADRPSPQAEPFCRVADAARLPDLGRPRHPGCPTP